LGRGPSFKFQNKSEIANSLLKSMYGTYPAAKILESTTMTHDGRDQSLTKTMT
jgi:hypothetical protein